MTKENITADNLGKMSSAFRNAGVVLKDLDNDGKDVSMQLFARMIEAGFTVDRRPTRLNMLVVSSDPNRAEEYKKGFRQAHESRVKAIQDFLVASPLINICPSRDESSDDNYQNVAALLYRSGIKAPEPSAA